MANCITRHIPNTVTCCNLLSGCAAAVMAFQSNYEAATLFIILGAVFDFFDGMLARLLGVSGLWVRSWTRWLMTLLSVLLQPPLYSPCSKKFITRNFFCLLQTISHTPHSSLPHSRHYV